MFGALATSSREPSQCDPHTAISFLTYSTDSAGFALSESNKLMRPTKEEVQDCVVFLGLVVDGERYLTPACWPFPSIPCLDYDHKGRLFIKNLKYETKELTGNN